MIKKKFLPFEEAREYVRKLGLKGQKEWIEFTKSDKFPEFLPKYPVGTYKDEWQGVTDWVGGTRSKYLTGDQLLSFEEAREYVRKLGLKGQKEWHEYCKSGKKPYNMPSAPFSAYKKEWIGFSDWLGKKRVKCATPRSYEEARKFSRSLGLASRKEWGSFVTSDKCPFDIPKHPEKTYREEFSGYEDWLDYKKHDVDFLSYYEAGKKLRNMGIVSSTQFLNLSRNKNRPKDIPPYPHLTYKKGWKGWPDFLSTKNLSLQKKSKNMLPFEEAREYVGKLGINSFSEWRKYCSLGKKPNNIPSLPDITYLSEWCGWRYWLGKTNKKTAKKLKFLPFEEAREYVRKLGLKEIKEWNEFKKSENFPNNIPKNPSRVYAEFTDYANWLNLKPHGKILPFEEAREYVRKLGLKGQNKYKLWLKTEERPSNIPSTPYQSYKKDWKGWPDFLGYDSKTGKYASEKFRPFEEAREYVRKLGLKGQKEWYEYTKSGKKPNNIPSSPYRSYKDQFINLADWLGTKRTRSIDFLSFEKSREYVRKLEIKGKTDWHDHCREGKIPQNIPNSPDITFVEEWTSWYDWLGNDDPNWSVSNVKELLRELIKSKIIVTR